MLASTTETVTKLLSTYGYVAIFVLMVLESACVPIPSEVTMLFGGALTTGAVAGPGNELNIWVVAIAGIAGNLVGSWVAYWVGARGGKPFANRYGRYLLIRPHEVDKAHEWFERRGAPAVLIARLLPVIRTFISLPAGVAKMRWDQFTLYTLLGVTPFVVALAFIGRALGSRWEKALRALAPFTLLILAALGVGLIVYVSLRWRKVRTEYAELDARREA